MRHGFKFWQVKYRFLFLAALSVAPAATADLAKSTGDKKLALGYSSLGFNPPKAGSYKLQQLGTASDGDVIDSNGQTTSLFKLMESGKQPGKVVLLSFIYTTCSDINGCPLATLVLQKIKNRLTQEADLAKSLRLLTLSFNPQHDTPQKMREYGANLQGKGVDWHFLTTASEQKLQPILQAYKQSAEKVYDAKGRFTDTFNHSLRVYLIDPHQQIRNIYNADLLHADMVIADVNTLLMESENKQAAIPLSSGQEGNDKLETKARKKPQLFAAGDNKLNYETEAYQTQSVAISERQGKATDLMQMIKQPPLGLPKVPFPKDNPITKEKISLGRKLFYDRRLSLNNTFSCAICHIPEQGFTNNEMATAVGVEGRTVRRNSPTLYNVAYMQLLFHDGREKNLENQVWGPLLAHDEMANPSIGYVIDKIKNSPDYAGLFEKAFQKEPGVETIGMALASYERTLNSANSPFDRWYFGHDKQSLNAQAQQGYKLFTGKAGCSQCHTIDKGDALFTDHDLHNTGVGFKAAMSGTTPETTQRVQLAPGMFTDVPNAIINSVSEPKANDLGRYEITQKPEDRWRYKTPTLRNISLTAPYMHNGSFATLREVIEFYNRGGIPNENLDPLIKPLHLSDKEINQLNVFLGSLTGDNIEELVSDAFAAPIGDSH